LAHQTVQATLADGRTHGREQASEGKNNKKRVRERYARRAPVGGGAGVVLVDGGYDRAGMLFTVSVFTVNRTANGDGG
jgi:hypothetical protein